MPAQTIPTIEDLEAETTGLNSRQLHELSLRLKTELALAQARISESYMKHNAGIHVPINEINAMNLTEAILRARSEHMRVIYSRRSEQRAVTDHQRLLEQVTTLKAENKELKATLKRLNPES